MAASAASAPAGRSYPAMQPSGGPCQFPEKPSCDAGYPLPFCSDITSAAWPPALRLASLIVLQAGCSRAAKCGRLVKLMLVTGMSCIA